MIQISSTIENISTRKDGTIKVVLGTQELDHNDMAELMSLYNKIGWFCFAENKINIEDVPIENAPEFKTDKTPSKRQRDILWVIWDKQGKNGDFETFYKIKMEQIADWLKEKYLI